MIYSINYKGDAVYKANSVCNNKITRLIIYNIHVIIVNDVSIYSAVILLQNYFNWRLKSYKLWDRTDEAINYTDF